MPIQIEPPKVYKFALKNKVLFGRVHKPINVSIKRIRQGDNEERNSIVSLNMIGKEFPQGFIQFLRERDVFLTMTKCNITVDKKPFFHFENGKLVDYSEFNNAWEQIDSEVANEIQEYVYLVNPEWKL
jgi:hypothetical protein